MVADSIEETCSRSLAAPQKVRGCQSPTAAVIVARPGWLRLAPLQKPVDVGGVRMFFLADPDGTSIELIEFPRGATTSAAFNGA